MIRHLLGGQPIIDTTLRVIIAIHAHLHIPTSSAITLRKTRPPEQPFRFSADTPTKYAMKTSGARSLADCGPIVLPLFFTKEDGVHSL